MQNKCMQKQLNNAEVQQFEKQQCRNTTMHAEIQQCRNTDNTPGPDAMHVYIQQTDKMQK